MDTTYFLIVAFKYCILMLSLAWLINMLCGPHPYLNTRF